MARPLYENQTTLEKERTLAEQLIAAWGCSVGKLPIRYGIDYAFLRDGALVGFAELKCRTIRRDAFPTMMVSLGKMISAQALHQVTHVPIVLVVEWTDCVGWTEIAGKSACKYKVALGGRKDRNDEQDNDVVALIPINEFRRL